MRLVDATTLRSEFTGNFHEMWHYTGIQAMIDVAPTVDAEPVRHGRWEESKSLEDCFWVCSNCKFSSQATAAPRLYNYCPNCGAKMDEVK